MTPQEESRRATIRVIAAGIAIAAAFLAAASALGALGIGWGYGREPELWIVAVVGAVVAVVAAVVAHAHRPPPDPRTDELERPQPLRTDAAIHARRERCDRAERTVAALRPRLDQQAPSPAGTQANALADGLLATTRSVGARLRELATMPPTDLGRLDALHEVDERLATIETGVRTLQDLADVAAPGRTEDAALLEQIAQARAAVDRDRGPTR